MFLIPIIIFYYILIYSIHNNSYAKKNSYVKKKNSLPPGLESTTYNHCKLPQTGNIFFFIRSSCSV